MSIASPPPSRHSSISTPAVSASLDILLERYLHLLDDYTKLKEQLSKDFSSGFLSLAQANFNAPSHVRHYGEDLYDERMRAVLRIEIEQSTPASASAFKCISLPITTTAKTSKSTRSRSSSPSPEEPPLQLPTPEATPEPDPAPTSPSPPLSSHQDSAFKAKSDSSPPATTFAFAPEPSTLISNSTTAPASASAPSASLSNPAASPSPILRDPIRQFGVLVPSALRAAQASFSIAVKGNALDLIRVNREMEYVEAEIRIAREQQKTTKDGEKGS